MAPKRLGKKREQGRQNNTTTTDEEEEEATPFLLSSFDCERETCFDRSNRLDGMLLFFLRILQVKLKLRKLLFMRLVARKQGNCNRQSQNARRLYSSRLVATQIGRVYYSGCDDPSSRIHTRVAADSWTVQYSTMNKHSLSSPIRNHVQPLTCGYWTPVGPEGKDTRKDVWWSN